jgi:hypothetical protein
LITEKPVHLDITLKSGYWIDPPKFFKQIDDAGYQARRTDVRLTLTGKITQEGDRLLLVLDDVKPGTQKFVLVKGESKKDDVRQKLADAFKEAGDLADKQVELEVEWKAPTDKKDKAALPTLAVIRVLIPKPKVEGK